MSLAATAERWDLRLYVAGKSPAAERALANLERLCAQHLDGRYAIEVVDLFERPWLAEAAKIVMVPTLVRRRPSSSRRLIGDLSDDRKVLAGLDIPMAS